MKVLAVGIVLMMVGCANAPKSPFDVYQSPLLAQVQGKRAKNSTFDPRSLGDFPEETDDAVVASTEDASPWRPTDKPKKKGSEKRDVKPVASSPKKTTKLPSLSSVRPTKSRVGPRNDVSMVLAVLAVNDVKVEPSASSAVGLYKMCKADKKVHFKPKAVPGDVVFFHNSQDLNGDGRNNDWYSLVGIVTGVDENQTATVTVFKDNRVSETKLNLLNPDMASIDGIELNGRIREPAADDAPYTQYHAGELFAGFCNVLGNRKDFKMFETWSP